MHDDTTWQAPRMRPRPTREPEREQLIETCWQALHVTSARVLSCAIVRTEAGLEVRLGYSEQKLLRQYATEMGAARVVAEEWLRVTTAGGNFTALD